jgi:subtilase family serine protease
MSFRIFSTFIFAALLASIIFVPAAALYDFEGIPLTVHAQGTVSGDVLTFGKYGLSNPPYELQFSLPSAPRYARVYTGIWGGTEKYTGWAELNVNDLKKAKYVLNGERDRNRDVYESGHGIYWIGYDTTEVLKKGNNVITVSTSKNDPGNKLDGRVYGVFVVAVVDDPAGGTTRYWIAEGNENLHGEGWAGTNPTKHDETNITFSGADVHGLTGANLTVLLLAGGKGQPDFVQFNNRYLGVPVRTVNGFNVTDIGDEISFNAEEGSGIESRYVDAETFSVGNSVQPSNTVRFIRGIDLNGDEAITTTGDAPEGEDYIHPVMAILTEKITGSTPATDLAIESLDVSNAYNGEIATLTAEVRSYGVQPTEAVPVAFFANGNLINTTKSVLHPSGITRVSVPWAATSGIYTLSAEVPAPGDSQPGNNGAQHQVTIGTPPDLSVSVGTPFHKDAAAGAGVSKAPLSLIPVIAAIGALALFRKRKYLPAVPAIVLAVALIVASFGLVAPAGAVSEVQEYSLPVQIANNGGSDSPTFVVSVYLDGEKIADRQVSDGIKAHSSVSISIPVFTSPGSHEMKIIADEAGQVRDQSRSNNLVQGRYDFPK